MFSFRVVGGAIPETDRKFPVDTGSVFILRGLLMSSK